MRQVLIIAAQFPPGNMTAGHRTRHIAAHLPEYGWRPKVLSVEPCYYGEMLDFELEKLLPEDMQVIRAKALPAILGLIRDIGIRSFWWHYRAICRAVREEKIDLLYIPVPPYYSMLLGRLIRFRFGIPFAVDYIDPWVHPFPGSQILFSKGWFAYQLSRVLEPIALSGVSLITAPAAGYYEDIFRSYPQLKSCPRLSFAYGAEESDYQHLEQYPKAPYLFDPADGNSHIVYAGAMLPRAYSTLEAIFAALAALKTAQPDICRGIKLHFIGTGLRRDDPGGFTIKPIAEKWGLADCVCEKPERIPYLDVLTHLKYSSAVLILGSSEPHYTPSKIFEALLSGRPVLAILHAKSAAVDILKDSGAGAVIAFDENRPAARHKEEIISALSGIRQGKYAQRQLNRDVLNAYSARRLTADLAEAFDAVVKKSI